MVEVRELKEASQRALDDINTLLPQLRTHTDDKSEHSATLEELSQVTQSTNVVLVVAMDSERIVGMASLYIMQKFSKKVASVEDVVVSSDFRGQKLGERVMEKIIACARERGVKTLYLTSRPDRVAAQGLYKKLGFQIKETDVFRLTL